MQPAPQVRLDLREGLAEVLDDLITQRMRSPLPVSVTGPGSVDVVDVVGGWRRDGRMARAPGLRTGLGRGCGWLRKTIRAQGAYPLSIALMCVGVERPQELVESFFARMSIPAVVVRHTG